ncbi:MAG: thiamine-phosphate kinase [Deltaproteobacteria bacterium]|nr:thiamine-phosphate kinase [Deltaproteobacteria bacterium]
MDELALLQHLLQGVATQAEGLLAGVGDDCAVLAASGSRDWLITTDALVEGIHFRREWASWEAIGRKSALVNISDIAAMGGRPRFCLVTLAIPDDLPVPAVMEFYCGLRAAADQFQMTVIGGDTVQGRKSFCASITAVGEVPHGRAVYRRGARPGDGCYVTGALGGATIGLEALQRRLSAATYGPFIERHMRPTPRVAAGQWLTATGCVTSMIDLSDGLLTDLERVAAASGVGARLEAVRIPLFPEMSPVAEGWKRSPIAIACASGEEYELAFTVAGAREYAFQRFLPAAEKTLGHAITRIGAITQERGVAVVDPEGRPLELTQRGFVHQFRDA